QGSVTADHGLVSTGSVTVDGGTLSVEGTFTVATQVTVQNSGTVCMAGANLDAPLVVVQATGTLWAGGSAIAGELDNYGLVVVGGPNASGSLSVSGDYRQGSAATLNLRLDPQSVNDLVFTSGAAYLAGTLHVD